MLTAYGGQGSRIIDLTMKRRVSREKDGSLLSEEVELMESSRKGPRPNIHLHLGLCLAQSPSQSPNLYLEGDHYHHNYPYCYLHNK